MYTICRQSLLLLAPALLLPLFGCLSSRNEQEISVSTTTQDIPPIFLDPSQQYNTSRYLVAVGSGDSIEAAQQSALSGVSQQIEVRVQSAFEASETYSSRGAEDALIDTRIFDLSQASSDENLIGVEYGESYQDNLGRIYAIAYIDRVTAGNVYSSRLEALASDIALELEEAKKTSGLRQFAHYLKAENHSLEHEQLLQQLEVISPAMASLQSSQTIRTATVQSLRSQSAAQLSFSLRVTIQGSLNPELTEQLNTQIQLETSQLLNNFGFLIAEEDSAYLAETSVLWNEDTSGTYATVYWDLTFQILETQSEDAQKHTLLSRSDRGRTRGISFEAARRSAVIDISDELSKSFVTYIRDQLSQ